MQPHGTEEETADMRALAKSGKLRYAATIRIVKSNHKTPGPKTKSQTNKTHNNNY